MYALSLKLLEAFGGWDDGEQKILISISSRLNLTLCWFMEVELKRGTVLVGRVGNSGVYLIL